MNYFRAVPSRPFFATLPRGALALFWGVLVVVTAPAQVLLLARVDLVAAVPSTAQPIPTVITAPKARPPKKRTRVLALSGDDWLRYFETPSTLEDDIAGGPGIVLHDGGVLRLNADLDIKLGLGEGEISWDGSGGFAAYGSERRVRIGTPDGKPLQWGKTANFLGADDALVFGARDADATLVWDSALNLVERFEKREIRVIKGATDFSGATVRFDSSFTGGWVAFKGDGRVDINAANDGLLGGVVAWGTELRLTGKGTLRSVRSVHASFGASFILDNLGTYNAYRLGNNAVVTLYSGTFGYWGRSAGSSREKVGAVRLARGANTIDVVNNSANANTRLILGGIGRSEGATVNFTNSRSTNGEFGAGATKTPQIKITNTGPPDSRVTAISGILPYATVNGRDFATLRGAYLVAYGGYRTGDPSGWNKNVNASPTSDHVLSRSTELNSLRLTGQRLTIHDSGLRLAANALLATGAKESQINGGPLYYTTGRTDDLGYKLFAHVYGSGGLTISAPIQRHPSQGGVALGLVKVGDGTLRLSGDRDNDLTSARSYVNQGTLILAKTGGAIALGGNVEIGDRGLGDAILRLEGSHQLAADTGVLLYGRSKDVRGANSQGGRGILQFGKAAGRRAGITQTVRSLNVAGQGVIDFDSGSSPDSPNTFYIEEQFGLINYGDGEPLLIVRGWQQYSDRILIRRSADLSIADLSKIKFEGYDSAHLVDYNADYLELTPFAPEPAVYGALLGTLSLGFFAWRKRRKIDK